MGWNVSAKGKPVAASMAVRPRFHSASHQQVRGCHLGQTIRVLESSCWPYTTHLHCEVCSRHVYGGGEAY